MIRVYDILGRLVVRLHEGLLTPEQRYIFYLEAATLPPGVYLVRVEAEQFPARHGLKRNVWVYGTRT